MNELWLYVGVICHCAEACEPLTLSLKTQESLQWFMDLRIRENTSCLIVHPFMLGLGELWWGSGAVSHLCHHSPSVHPWTLKL